jgi:protein-tyrosine-phosphatase/tRNA A37 threonylcarbamoyladenosine synthetase subunit TsaC/SUA5/YrdC
MPGSAGIACDGFRGSVNMPELVDWQVCPPADVAALAARVLSQGRLVTLPTESGPEIAASALHADAVAALQKIAEPSEPLAVVVTAMEEAKDWLPFLGEPGRRLVRKLGQGPWKLIADGGADFGQLQWLPEPVRNLLCPARHLALRWPDHPVWNMTARLLKQPMVSALCTKLNDDRVVSIADSVLQPAIAPTTLIRVTGKQWQVARPGGLSDESLDELMPCRVLFVCTGNTCRSPMAEALMKRLLADRLGCRSEELRPRGFLVQSAGLAAMMGGEAAPDAVGVVRAFGADLAGHLSRRLTLEQLMLADHVFAMTESHLWALESVDVPGLPTPRLLSPDGDDVPDPIGAAPEVYRACAHEILGHLQKRLPEIL